MQGKELLELPRTSLIFRCWTREGLFQHNTSEMPTAINFIVDLDFQPNSQNKTLFLKGGDDFRCTNAFSGAVCPGGTCLGTFAN